MNASRAPQARTKTTRQHHAGPARLLAAFAALLLSASVAAAEPDLAATRGETAANERLMPPLPVLPPLSQPPPAEPPDGREAVDGADDQTGSSVSTDEVKPFGPLRIVSWHLDDAKAAGALNMLPDPERAWRHTFGAERRTAPVNTFDAETLEADVVLLQGVRRISDARILFPARHWRLVVSRQMLAPVLTPRAANRFLLDEVVPGRPATTAIAVRYRRGLRVAGQAHITEVVVPVEAAADQRAPRETPAALAVRLLVDRKPLWVVSADLAAACVASIDRACTAFDTLTRWRSEQAQAGAVVIGGTVRKEGSCARQSLTATAATLVAATHVVGVGCIARLHWP